jgi:hypothetical protein
MSAATRLIALRDKAVHDAVTAIILAENHRLSPRSIEAVRSVLNALLMEAVRPMPVAIVPRADRRTDPAPGFDEDEPTHPDRPSSKHPKPVR